MHSPLAIEPMFAFSFEEDDDKLLEQPIRA